MLPNTLLIALSSQINYFSRKLVAPGFEVELIEVTGGVSRAVAFVRWKDFLDVALRNRVAESLEH